MSYSLITKAVYEHPKTDTAMLNLKLSESIAWNVVRFFESRGGFDHWWDNIDEETKDEIFEGLVAEIEGTTKP